MTKYTPTTTEIQAAWAVPRQRLRRGEGQHTGAVERVAEADRAITHIRREAQAEALREAAARLLETGMVWPIERVQGVIGAARELRNRANHIKRELSSDDVPIEMAMTPEEFDQLLHQAGQQRAAKALRDAAMNDRSIILDGAGNMVLAVYTETLFELAEKIEQEQHDEST